MPGEDRTARFVWSEEDEVEVTEGSGKAFSTADLVALPDDEEEPFEEEEA